MDSKFLNFTLEELTHIKELLEHDTDDLKQVVKNEATINKIIRMIMSKGEEEDV